MKDKFWIISLLICLFVTILSACNGGEETVAINEEDGIISGNYYILYSESPMYDSVSHLARRATDVIRGEVLDRRTELRNTTLSKEEALEDMRNNFTEEEFLYFYGEGVHWVDFEPHYEVVTIHRIRILEVFQGSYQVGDIKEIMQSGGTYGNTTVSNSDLISFKTGDDLVFFLYSWSHFGRPAVLLNPFQSVYRFPAIDENEGSLDLDVELENVYGDTHFNDLRITLNDLLQLAER